FAGALVATAVAPAVIEAAVGVLAAASGAHALLGGGASATRPRAAPSARMLLGAGAFTGLTSSLTGTGGPLVLVPILVWLELPVLLAIGLAQTIQLPIAALATAGYVVGGTLDVAIGVSIGAGIVAGTWVSARVAHALPRTVLRRIVAALLVVVGASILAGLASGSARASAERQAHARDAAARAGAGLERDRAAVVLDDLPAQHEAAAGAARPRREKPDASVLRAREPRPVVLDLGDDASAPVAPTHAHAPAAVAGRLDRVFGQVDHDLLDLSRVDRDVHLRT